MGFIFEFFEFGFTDPRVEVLMAFISHNVDILKTFISPYVLMGLTGTWCGL